MGCNDVTLTLSTDLQTPANHTSWDIVTAGTNFIVTTGTGYASNSVIPVVRCLPDGCYDLRVYDSFGDGINPGGYVLTDVNNNRLIDNTANGNGFTTLSRINPAAGAGFCLPTGSVTVTQGCDQMSLVLTQSIKCSASPAVSAQLGVGVNSDDGYQFWIFNPNGGFTRRLFQSLSTPGSGWPVGTLAADKPTYMLLNAMNNTTSAPPMYSP